MERQETGSTSAQVNIPTMEGMVIPRQMEKMAEATTIQAATWAMGEKEMAAMTPNRMATGREFKWIFIGKLRYVNL